LGFCPELLSGEFFSPVEESVPHQVFSSSPVITGLVRGLLGLKGNALRREIEFRPSIPGAWDKVKIRNFRVGKDVFHFNVQRAMNKLVLQIEPKAHAPYRLHLSPSLGYGTQVKAVKVNGEEKDFRIEGERGEVRCLFSLDIKDKTLVEIMTQKSIFLYLPPYFPQIGNRTAGLKIIRAQYRDNQLSILVEGLGGMEYDLSLITPRSLASVVEAKAEEKGNLEIKIKINFRKEGDGYSRKEVKVLFK